MTKKILILGYKSYVATGLAEQLQKAGFDVDCFSRGEYGKAGNIILGDILHLSSNDYFSASYDIVLNFILLKNSNIENNIKYIAEVVAFCKTKNVKRLIHISSISVYSNNAGYVNENTSIETDISGKGLYSSQKIGIDKFLQNQKDLPFEICFVRPGFVVSDVVKSPLSGIAIKLPMNFCVLLGNRKTTLPLVERDTLQKALVEITQKEQNKNVYLLLRNDKGTKYKYVKEHFGYYIFTLPKSLILFAAKTLKFCKILNYTKYQQIKGLFKSTCFDSSATEKELRITF